ncbi:hypothetical protein I3842_01G258200 [Carya illinoinensis]|uniref:Protein kinase domain-containing protein n=1 Tax=Carya illinoinensis TaxID=32201 RepID=A0A922G9R8_CARIL|nr:hypothetical protein I3842_01G258200 [Carya illinoinensis]
MLRSSISESVGSLADYGPQQLRLGTIVYMSLERINTNQNHGQYNGYAGDIWSFGASILEFYMGKFPFKIGRQGDWATLMCTICMAQPLEVLPTASREFLHFIACCLQREPSRRWTASQLLTHPFITQRNHTQSQVHQNLHQLLPPPCLFSS